MTPIPLPLRREMAADDWYKKCCLCNELHVQWHHNLIWGGRQTQAKFCILPVCERHHEGKEGVKVNAETRRRLNEIMYMRATPKEREKYGLKKPDGKKKNPTKYTKCSKCGADNTLLMCCGKIKHL